MSKSAYLTVREVAAELGVSTNAVYKLIQRGRLKALRKHAHGMKVSRLALDAYLRRLQTSTDYPGAPAPGASDPADIGELRIRFAKETGVSPTEWEFRWKDGQIEDTSTNMRRTIQALALIHADREEIDHGQIRSRLVEAAFSTTR